MKRILITGANGFIGQNLDLALRRIPEVEIDHATSADSVAELQGKAAEADFIFHLAGSNRPKAVEEFHRVNVGVTQAIVDAMLSNPSKRQTIVLASSIQANADNPYGNSKKLAEDTLAGLDCQDSKCVLVYRLPNVFGKWSRPNYNSVVATFCHNIARDLPITISAAERELELVYVDDVIAEWLRRLEGESVDESFCTVKPTHRCTLGNLAERIQAIHEMRRKLHVPDLSDPLNFALHATYTSFLDESDLARCVDLKTDERGWLFEMTKSPAFGQVFVSTTKPGVVRGNHYHDSKIERFCLIQGSGIIRFRKVGTEKVIEYPVTDSNIQLVDIPPGYTHSIENVGQADMVVLFWANEIFDPAAPDTHFEKVLF